MWRCITVTHSLKAIEGFLWPWKWYILPNYSLKSIRKDLLGTLNITLYKLYTRLANVCLWSNWLIYTMWQKCGFLDGTWTTKKKKKKAPSCLTMKMITEDIWVLMKDFLWCQSIKLIHTCQKKTEMYHCSHVVVTRFDAARLVMGYEWQLVPWLSAQHSHDFTWVCLYATHTVTWSPTSERFHIKDKWFSWYVEMTAWILEKMTIIYIFCPNCSCI